VVGARHPQRSVGLEDALGDTELSDRDSRSFLKPIERSHYERVYEVAITLRETSQSRPLHEDQDLDQLACVPSF
jgi:hypothetical protein